MPQESAFAILVAAANNKMFDKCENERSCHCSANINNDQVLEKSYRSSLGPRRIHLQASP